MSTTSRAGSETWITELESSLTTIPSAVCVTRGAPRCGPDTSWSTPRVLGPCGADDERPVRIAHAPTRDGSRARRGVRRVASTPGKRTHALVSPARRVQPIRTAGRPSTVDHRGGDDVHRRRADELGHEQVDRVLVELDRCAALHDPSVAHHRRPVAHRHRLDLIVRDIERRDRTSWWRAMISNRVSVRSLASRFDIGSSIKSSAACARSRGPSPPAAAVHRRAGRGSGRAARSVASTPAVSAHLALIWRLPSLASRSAKPMFSPTVRCG